MLVAQLSLVLLVIFVIDAAIAPRSHHASPRAFYVDKLTEGIATIAAAFWPKPVIVRLSDFKSNEYKKLIGGSRYEPEEENPMLGFRGASRYVSESFGEAFAMECEALVRVRRDMGFTNVEVMVPFVRTLGQAERVVAMLAEHGLKRASAGGSDGLRVIMMCEVPSNAVLAEAFHMRCPPARAAKARRAGEDRPRRDRGVRRA